MSGPKNHPLVIVSALLALFGAAGACVVAAAEPAAVPPAAVPPAATTSAPVDFARDVQPILAQNCYKCHDGAHRKGGLQLDEKQKALAGGDDGPILTAGDPDKSKLIHFVRGDDPKEVMPPKGKGERLKPEQVDVLVRWVKQGAVWPDGAVATTAKPP